MERICLQCVALESIGNVHANPLKHTIAVQHICCNPVQYIIELTSQLLKLLAECVEYSAASHTHVYTECRFTRLTLKLNYRGLSLGIYYEAAVTSTSMSQ